MSGNDYPTAARGRAAQMPTRIRAPPNPWIGVSASARISQPNKAAAMASRKITSDENTGGSRPSATARRPWPPAWLMNAIAQDKKVVRGALTFILTRGIGQSFIEKNVDPAAVRAYLDERR